MFAVAPNKVQSKASQMLGVDRELVEGDRLVTLQRIFVKLYMLQASDMIYTTLVRV